MDPSQDFKSMQDKIQTSLVSTTRTVNQIANEDLAFQRTANPTVDDRLDDQSTRLLALSSGLLDAAAKAHGQRAVGSLEDAEDVDINWTSVVDVVDGLLEKADISLDEYTGRVKRKSDFPEIAQPSKKSRTNERFEPNWRRANIVKPQNAFEKPTDNFATGPWKPLLTRKPHATVPLEESLGVPSDADKQYDYAVSLPLLLVVRDGVPLEEKAARARYKLNRRVKMLSVRAPIRGANDDFRYRHPYETEIASLKYPEKVYQKRDPIPSQPIEKEPAEWVDTYEGVLEMLEDLKQADEIAVDLEHHDFRTYQGLLSLMQISTRDKDWVIDTLRPWRYKLEILNEVFADPKIVKVFHGAFMDIIWLQRDLGLYIVGLFDTYHACVALSYPQRSLAGLLKKFVNFDADKKYQMADWRIRPLTEEMMYYARCDTHYLLYIYDRLCNELIDESDPTDPEKNLLEYVLQGSKETSLDRFVAYESDPETGEGTRGWANGLMKAAIRLDGPQFAVYKAVHKWRDDMAREEDENPAFIMPTQTLMEISRLLPSDPKALHSILGGKCASRVQQSLQELFDIISEAKKAGADGPSSVEHFRNTMRDGLSVAAIAERELNTTTKAELDLPPVEELRSQKSQLFGSMPVSTRWEDEGKAAKNQNDVLVSLPWVTFVQDAALATAQQEAQSKAQKKKELDIIPLDDAPKPAPPAPKVEVVDNTEFTLRQGRKRKIEESDDDDEGGGAPVESHDMISLDVEETKEERRARRKALKKANKEAERGMKYSAALEQQQKKPKNNKKKAANDDEEDEAPFDYSQAQSVMHAQRAMLDNRQATGRAKAFDPYAARMNAEGPKAARRMHHEKTGKTATYKK